MYCAMVYWTAVEGVEGWPGAATLLTWGGGRASIDAAEPRVSWLSVCSAKSACARAATGSMGCEEMRNPCAELESTESFVPVALPLCAVCSCAGRVALCSMKVGCADPCICGVRGG